MDSRAILVPKWEEMRRRFLPFGVEIWMNVSSSGGNSACNKHTNSYQLYIHNINVKLVKLSLSYDTIGRHSHSI